MAISNHKIRSCLIQDTLAKSHSPTAYPVLVSTLKKLDQQLLVCPVRELWGDALLKPAVTTAPASEKRQYLRPSPALCLSFIISFGLFLSWGNLSSNSWGTEVNWDGLWLELVQVITAFFCQACVSSYLIFFFFFFNLWKRQHRPKYCI